MRHSVRGRKLGRSTAHRTAMLRNLCTSLFTHERVRTTLMKAKEMRPYAERLITRSRRDTLAARREVARDVRDSDALRKLFSTLGPRYAERPGGYTRMYRLGRRPGDAAEMALIELVDAAPIAAAAEPGKDAAPAGKPKPKAARRGSRAARVAGSKA